jgi:hypothetical protein
LPRNNDLPYDPQDFIESKKESQQYRYFC